MGKTKILMTGLTGIVGRFIYTGLEDAYEVYYLVRNGANNNKLPSDIPNDRIFEADIEESFCGLCQEDFKKLKSIDIDKILHFASDVSFNVTDTDGKIYKTNYIGIINRKWNIYA